MYCVKSLYVIKYYYRLSTKTISDRYLTDKATEGMSLSIKITYGSVSCQQIIYGEFNIVHYIQRLF